MSVNLKNFIPNFLSGSFWNGGGGNNRWISQPNIFSLPFSMQKREQYVTITGNENFLYNTTPELKIVLDRLALIYATGVWQHLDKNGEIIENSPFVDLLENPNVFQSRNEFLFQWFIQRGIYGNAFTYQLKGFDTQEIPSALWNLPPSRMTLNRTGKIWQQTEIDEIISSYVFKMNEEGQSDIIYKTNEIIQFSMPDTDDPILGKSPLESIRMPISNIRAAYGYRNVILTKKGAIGVWSSDSKDQMGSVKLTPEEESELSKQLQKNQGIGDNQDNIAISKTALKWTPSTYPTKDLLLFEEVDANKKAIIDLFGANENMFSRPSGGQGSTFNNVAMGERQAIQNTIEPIADDFANGLSKRWGLLDKGETLKLSYEHLPAMKSDGLQESQILERKARAAAILSGEGLGFTAAQIREIIEF